MEDFNSTNLLHEIKKLFGTKYGRITIIWYHLILDRVTKQRYTEGASGLLIVSYFLFTNLQNIFANISIRL